MLGYNGSIRTLRRERIEITLIDTPFPKSLYHTVNKIFSGVTYWERASMKSDYLWFVKSLSLPKECKNIKNIDLIFTFYFGPKRRRYDCDNCSFMVKMLIDCLIERKVFENDSPKYINSIKILSKKSRSNHLIVTYEQIL